jgi:UDP-GlcNAc3NAcA epimerase
MSEVFFTELELAPPRHHLDIHGGTHGAMTGRMLTAIEEVLLAERPDAVIVYGDTNSTVAGALAAAKLDIPVVHVEAGMRSFNRRMPEEINRVVVDHLAAILFCSTTEALANLTREGIVAGVHKVGDISIDTARLAAPLAARHSRILERRDLRPQTYGVVTLHRAGNTDDRDRFATLLRFIADEATQRPLIFPVHPRTRAAAKAAGLDLTRPGVTLIEPLGYLDMFALVRGASLVLTDSGGLQKEAWFHRVPCITLRDETEWVETIRCGWNRLWTEPAWLPRRDIADYGDGHAAEEMVAILEQALR